MEGHVQLGLYQYAVDHGAVDDLTAAPPRPAAPSSSSSASRTTGREAVVQPQAVQADDGPERTDLRARLARPAALVRAESFPAMAGDHCRDCNFVPICPVKGAGSVTSQ